MFDLVYCMTAMKELVEKNKRKEIISKQKGKYWLATVLAAKCFIGHFGQM